MTLLPSHRDPGTEPVLEPHTVASGEPLEDYTWLDTVQIYPRRGPHLPWEGWFLLPEALKHRVRRGPLNPTRARHVDTLTEHGLLHEGRLTPPGREIADVLAVAGPRLTVHAWSAGERQHTLEVFIAGPAAAILSTRAPHGPSVPPDQPAPDDGPVFALDLVEVTWIPVAIAAWTGTAPAWTFSVAPDTIDHDVLIRRLHGEQVPPPPDADPHLLDVWQQPWWSWRLESSGTAPTVNVLHAGRRGCYRLGAGPQQSSVVLIPAPAVSVWHALLTTVQTTITATPQP